MKHKKQFIVDIGSIRRQPGARMEVKLEGKLPDLQISFSKVDEDEAISLEVLLEQVYEGILVTGRLSTKWQGDCRRCLGSAEGRLTADIRELYAEHMNDELVYELSGEELDLEPLVHDSCILSLPLAPLCKTDCAGICAGCGVNLNIGSCSCAAPVDPRWSKLSLVLEQNDT